MNPERKKRFVKMAFFLNGVLFLLGGIGLLGDEKMILGVLQILAGILNLLMLRKMKNNAVRAFLNYSILLMNVVVALSIAIDYFRMDKAYVQYMWLIAAIVSAIAFIIHIRRKKPVIEKTL